MLMILLLAYLVSCLAGPATDSSVVHFADGAEKLWAEKDAIAGNITTDGIADALGLRNNLGQNTSNKSQDNFTGQNELSKIKDIVAVRAVAEGNADFGLRLYDKAKDEESSNLLMSPYSVSSAMAMVSLGARGKTLKEVKKEMKFPEKTELIAGYSHVFSVLKGNENFTLETANKLFVQDGFPLLEDFVKVMKEDFVAEVTETDFAEMKGEVARKLINDWVEEKTKEKIKDLIAKDILNERTKLVLVNAIYFKGDWASKFDSEITRRENFYVKKGRAVKVQMMNKMSNFKMTYVEDLHSEAIELPYKGDRVSMYIILPREKFGLDDVETKLSRANLLEVFSTIDNQRERKVHLGLPKFTLEKTINLKEFLKQLGIVDLFVEGSADLSGMDGRNDLFVSKVIQKAFIEVNEEGSEAAAATAVVASGRSAGGPPPSHLFMCDHPFIFFIRDKMTDMVMFEGRITNPKLG